MKKSVVIVTVILATVLLLGLGTAMADSILFPYFKSGAGDVTFFQIINTATVATPISGTSQGKLDYIYVYNAGSEVCQHYDDAGRMTKNDILLYEATGVYPGQLLPGDTTSTSPKLPLSSAWGYLIVKQNSSNFTLSSSEGTLFGQAYVANINTGTVYAYNAVNDPGEWSMYEFSSNAVDDFILSFLPETVASTTWFFFPVDFGVDLTTDVVWDIHAIIGANWGGVLKPGGVFDNNESLKSGTRYVKTGCWDEGLNQYDGTRGAPEPVSANFFYTLSQIMSGAQYNAEKGTGGFTELFWDYPVGYAYKIQSSSVLGKPMSTFLYEPGFYSGYYWGTTGAAAYSYTK